jgi:hypothetical protein
LASPVVASRRRVDAGAHYSVGTCALVSRHRRVLWLPRPLPAACEPLGEPAWPPSPPDVSRASPHASQPSMPPPNCCWTDTEFRATGHLAKIVSGGCTSRRGSLRRLSVECRRILSHATPCNGFARQQLVLGALCVATVTTAAVLSLWDARWNIEGRKLVGAR